MAKSSLRIGRYINNGTKYISLYSEKSEALSTNSSSNKKCLCYNSADGVLYAATNDKPDSPTASVLKFYDNGEWRYVHEYTVRKKNVYYDPYEVNPTQKPYSQYPNLYSETQRNHPTTYKTEVVGAVYATRYYYWMYPNITIDGITIQALDKSGSYNGDNNVKLFYKWLRDNRVIQGGTGAGMTMTQIFGSLDSIFFTSPRSRPTYRTEYYFKNIYGQEVYRNTDYNAVSNMWVYYNSQGPGMFQTIQQEQVYNGDETTDSEVVEIQASFTRTVVDMPAYSDSAIQVDVPY